MGGKHSARAMQLFQVLKTVVAAMKVKTFSKNNKMKKWTKEDWVQSQVRIVPKAKDLGGLLAQEET